MKFKNDPKGTSKNDVTALQFCDDCTEALIIICTMMRGGPGVSKNIKNFMTSLMDDPHHEQFQKFNF